MKIANKIGLSFIIVASICVGVVVPIVYKVVKDNIKKEIFEHLKTTAYSRANHVETHMEEDKKRIALMAQSDSVEAALKANMRNEPDSKGLLEKVNLELNRLIEADDEVYQILVMDTRGKVIASSHEMNIGLDRSDHACFREGKNGLYVRDAHYFEGTEEKGYAISAPIRDDETGEFLGVYATRFNLFGLNELLADRTGLGRTGETYLVNKEGYMITPSRFVKDTPFKQKVDTENFRKEDLSAIPERPEVHIGHEAVEVFLDYRGIEALSAHRYIPEMQWVLIAEINVREALAPLFKIQVLVAVVIFCVPVAAWLMGVFASGFIVRPIHKLGAGIGIIGEGKLDYRVGTAAKDEIGQLSRAFDQMTANLKHSTISVERLNKEVAQRRRIEAILRASENKYRTLLENLPQKIFLKDANSVYVSCNANFARDLKIKCSEIAEKTDYDFFPKELAEKYRADDKRIIELGKSETIEEKYVQDGREIIVNTVKTPVKDEQDNIAGVLGIFWDITEQKNAREKIKQAVEEWNRTFNTISDLIFISDKDFSIVRCNKSFAAAIKMKPEEIIGKKCYELLHKSDRPWPNCPFEAAKIDKKARMQEVYDPNIGVPLLVTVSPLFDDKGEVVGAVHIARDITELKKGENKLKKAMRIKSEFTSMVSHELRTPLTAIKEGIAIVLDGTAGKVTAEQKDFLNTAKRNVDRLARLINDVLSFQRLEAGRMEFKMEKNDINVTIKEVQETMAPLAKEKKLDFIAKLDRKLPKITFDKDRITQVLANIINNALNFTEKGSITISAKKDKKVNAIRISIKDTGPGIKKEDLPRLFHRFEQVQSPKERKTGGAGLGLAISKEIIQKHKGKIWAESKLNKGMTIHFTLPVRA